MVSVVGVSETYLVMPRAKSLANLAVKNNNLRMKTNLNLVRVENAAIETTIGFIYYFHLKAEDRKDNGKHKMYLTAVWEKDWLNFLDSMPLEYAPDPLPRMEIATAPEISDFLKDVGEFTVSDHNLKTGTQLEFVNVGDFEATRLQDGTHFDLTLQACDEDGKHMLFKTKVIQHDFDKSMNKSRPLVYVSEAEPEPKALLAPLIPDWILSLSCKTHDQLGPVSEERCAMKL
ncbi:hypothetical protein IFM89_036976 [Coptis chinensis]|uniref:Cysteine proteinase inhibitor n=1 Tax=Coptis chinensis TaxID=261450 RepID=A0A835LJT1_9MAGN|nr:hypothetical protein IFM89_036976 [Coptis chinensis]